jgi:uncharacterized HAD superfamily protein
MAEEPKFNAFLLSEYNSLAQAHFQTSQALSSFFHYYVLIIGATVTASGVYVNYASGKSVVNPISATLPVALLLFVVAFVGFCLLCYISNLRFDAILYARSVNGIRKYYYDVSDLTPLQGSFINPLPKSIYFPRYFESRFFLSVVLTFSAMNSLSLLFSFWLLRKHIYFRATSNNDALANTLLTYFNWNNIFIILLIFAVFHLVFYYLLANYRENHYIRTNTIGVDIDGVLNQHRIQFSDIFCKLHGRKIDPEMITEIPVHHCKELAVSVTEELEVFHDPSYWETMPPIQGAAQHLRQLKEDYSFKIHIITSRPWPVLWRLPRQLFWKYFWLWSYKHIYRITKKWLRQNGFKYSAFTIEERNFTLFKQNVNYRNRFRMASLLNFRAFIEDDLKKAIKLSHFCQTVFLIDQPYNRCNYKLPLNLIRVTDIKEIIHYMRDYM